MSGVDFYDGKNRKPNANDFYRLRGYDTEKNLLKQINNCVNFDFIYEKVAPYYSAKGRKSIDPVVLIKMLLIGYLFGIKSERRLEQEVTLNIAYRWFCGLSLTDTVPDHSTFSKNRQRRFQEDTIFQEIFLEIVKKCIEMYRKGNC